MTDDEQAIRNVVDTWMSATRSGDLQTVLSLVADDALFMVPGREPFGKAEFAAASRSMTNVRVDGRSEVLEVQVFDGWAYLRNHIEVTIAAEGAPLVQRKGYTLTILRKEPDGRWVLARDANLVT
jgi:uncharacterized protein (TIGR02246 family)